MDGEGREKSVEEQLIEAKIEFVKSADAFDPLSPIKDHPWVSSAAAFAAGLGLVAARPNVKNLSIAPLVLQAGNLLLNFLSNKK